MRTSVILFILLIISCDKNNSEIIEKWENGSTKLERIYSHSKDNYLEKEYYENKQLAHETQFKNSKKNGEQKAYYNSGQLLSKCTYINGKINGDVFEFNKNGTYLFKGYQDEGNLAGLAIHYYVNGKPKVESFSTNGETFIINKWDSLGVQEILIEKGERVFKDSLMLDRNGNVNKIDVISIGLYNESLRLGNWKYYEIKTGKLLLERIYESGKIKSEEWK